MTSGNPQVEHRWEGKPVDLDLKNGMGKNVLGRSVQRKFDAYSKTIVKKWGHLVHPVTGARPNLVVNIRMPKGLKGALSAVEMILETEDAELRAWLKSKGVQVAERYVPTAGEEAPEGVPLAQAAA